MTDTRQGVTVMTTFEETYAAVVAEAEAKALRPSQSCAFWRTATASPRISSAVARLCT